MSLYSRIIERARGKDLYEILPDLQYRIPIMRILSGEEQGSAQGGYKASAGFYQSQVWVHKAIKVIKDSIAPLFVRVVEGKGLDAEPIENHEFTEVLQSPNPEQGPASFWEEWVTDQMLGGEWGIEIVKNERGSSILEMWPRQPTVFSISPVKERRRYRQVANYKIDDGYDDPYNLEPDEFIHIKFYNPLNPWRGLAPITAVRMGIVIDQLAQSWTRLFFRNQARPDFALIAPEGLTKTEKEEYMNELLTDHSSGEGLHRPLILEKGITDIKSFSFPPKDIEWLEQRKLSRDEIGGLFGVPDEIMGFGKDTYENFNAADRVLWTLTIVPLVKFRDRAITNWARRHKVIETRQRVETDLTAIPQLQEDKSQKMEQLSILAGKGYPVNVASEYLGLGLPPVKGGDVGYLPFSMVPVTQLGAELLSETGRSTRSLNKAAAPEYGSAEHEALWKRKQSRLDRSVKDMQRKLKRYFQDQQNEVVRLLRDNREYGRGQWAKNPERIPSPADLFDYDKWIEAFKLLFGPVIGRAVELVGQYELEALGLDLAFDVARPEVVSGIRHVLETVATKTNDTTWNGLIDLFQEAEAEGEGITAIQERLSAFFGDRKSDWQTERIARTTMTGASSHGSQSAWEQSEVVKNKIWVSAMIPGRTRDDHAAAHNQTVPLNVEFYVGGEFLIYPGDPMGSPGNIINCLCVMIAEVEE